MENPLGGESNGNRLTERILQDISKYLCKALSTEAFAEETFLIRCQKVIQKKYAQNEYYTVADMRAYFDRVEDGFHPSIGQFVKYFLELQSIIDNPNHSIKTRLGAMIIEFNFQKYFQKLREQKQFSIEEFILDYHALVIIDEKVNKKEFIHMIHKNSLHTQN